MIDSTFKEQQPNRPEALNGLVSEQSIKATLSVEKLMWLLANAQAITHAPHQPQQGSIYRAYLGNWVVEIIDHRDSTNLTSGLENSHIIYLDFPYPSVRITKKSFEEIELERSNRSNPIILNSAEWVPSLLASQSPLDDLSINQVMRENSYRERIRNYKVLVIGMGTVGGWILQTLAQQGFINLGAFEMEDEVLEKTNLNRYTAGYSQLGQAKWKVTAANIHDINYEANLTYHGGFDLEKMVVFERYDAVVLALDDVKLQLAAHLELKRLGIPTILSTDIGQGVRLELFNYSEPGVKILNGRVNQSDVENMLRGKGPDIGIPTIVGGYSNAVTRFDKGTIGYFALSNPRLTDPKGGIVKSFPQAVGAAQTGAASTTNLLIRLATGQNIPSNVIHIDSTLEFERGKKSRLLKLVADLLSSPIWQKLVILLSTSLEAQRREQTTRELNSVDPLSTQRTRTIES